MKKKLFFILMVAVTYAVLALVIFPVSFAGGYVWVMIDRLTGGVLFQLLQIFDTGNPIITGLIFVTINNLGIGALIGWGIYALEARRKANMAPALNRGGDGQTPDGNPGSIDTAAVSPQKGCRDK